MKNSFLNQKLMAALLLTLFAFSPAFAGSTSVFEDFQKHCKKNECEAPYNKVLVYDSSRSINLLSPEVLKELNSKAFQQAQIWGDTILEGEYFSEGHTKLLSVTALVKDNQLVGYHFKYSEKAWYVGDCNPGDQYKDLSKCQVGRIVESSFVANDMTELQNDFESLAEFETAE